MRATSCCNFVLRAGVCAALACNAGCAGTPGARSAYEGRAADDTFSITVPPAPPAPPQDSDDSAPNDPAPPALARGAWIMLDADGTLRAAVGKRIAGSPAPGVTRTLSLAQRDALWCQGVQAGVLDAKPVGAAAVASETSEIAGFPGTFVLVTNTHAGRRRSWLFAPELDANAYNRARAFADEIARAAWLDVR